MKQLKDRDLFSVKSNNYEKLKSSRKKKKEGNHKQSEDNEEWRGKKPRWKDNKAGGQDGKRVKRLRRNDKTSEQGGKKGKRHRSKDKTAEQEEESDRLDHFAIKHVPISYKNIHVGQIVLGSILHVFKYEIIVSLPNRMTGQLPVMHLSKSYNDLLYEVSEGKTPSNKLCELDDLYSPGHLLVLKVISVVPYDNGTSKITLSALPQDVNCELSSSLLSKHSMVQCAVVSDEENGYIMETGIRGIRSAFLSKKYAPERSFGVGSVLLCAVRKIIVDTEDTGESGINLNALPFYVNKEINLSKGSPNLASIFPGTLISGTITGVIPEGLELSFGEFKGFVRKENLTSYTEELEDFNNGQKVSARVLYITDLTSEIVCSMNTKLCSESAFMSELSSLSIDNIYSGNFLKHSSSSEGAYFSLPEGNYGHCPKRNMEKYLKESNNKKLQANAEYKCRVTHIHMIDQVYNVVLESEDDENTSGALFHVGKHVFVKIAEHNPNGALVVITKSNKIGRIPKYHLTDSNMSNPEEKCRIGNKFKGRILKYTPGKDPVITLKTDLITSELPIVSELSESSVGITTLGCIVKIYKRSILVEFFNDCKALVLNKDMPLHIRKDLNSHFHVGSVVKCKIISFDDTEKKLFASLVINVTSKDNKVSQSENLSAGPNSKIESLSASPALKSIVNCKVFSVNKENVEVIIEGSNEKGFIPLYHFADYVGVSKSIFRLLNEGDMINNVVVFGKSKSDLLLSAKPSVYHYVSKIKNGQIEEKNVLPSVVRKCFEDKVLVTIMEKKNISEYIIPKDFVVTEKVDSILNIGIEEGQTLFLKSFKSTKTKFCSHLHKVLPNSSTSGFQLLYDTLLQETMIRNLCLEMKLKDVVIGASYECKIVHSSNAGTLVRVSELGLDGVIHPSHYKDSCIPKLNETLEVRVLNVNYHELCLELTARRDIKEYFCKKSHNLKVKEEGKCVVLLAKKEYIIGRLLNLCSGQIIYLPSRRHVNDFNGRHSYYEIGREYDIIIEHVDDELVLANLKVHTQKEFKGISKQIPSFIFSSVYLRNLEDHLMFDEARYTHHDFKMRAMAKIERVTNWVETKKAKKNIEDSNKWKILKEDKFSQFDKEMYRKNLLERRAARKKLKKQKFGPIKAKKRKFNESFDENCKDEDYDEISEDEKDDEDYDEISKDDSKDVLEKDIVITESDNLDTLKTQKRQTKKKKLNLSNQETAMKDNYKQYTINETLSNSTTSNLKEKKRTKKINIKTEKSHLNKSLKQENENVFEENSDSEAMNQDDDHNSSIELETDGFDWSGNILGPHKDGGDDDDDESSSDEEIENDKEQKSVKKLSKYEKSLKGKAEEKRTRQLELERLDDDREPQTALDYEEKIEQNPHSSAMWIEYISFHLSNTEIEKARAVASRALATIPSTKEEERLAMWNVSLRLEVMYGTTESLSSSFKEALSRNDELKIYYIMIDIYLNANKFKEADELIKKMVKKHSQNREVWIKSFLYYFQANKIYEARNMLDKSLLSLTKQDHVEVINRFAQLELKEGDKEKGKTVFEALLSNHPKRLDIWNVYADLLLKQNDIQGTRVVLERITGLKLKMKPMRNAFKKLLEFEKKHGTPQRIEAVKAKVEEYVTKALAEGE